VSTEPGQLQIDECARRGFPRPSVHVESVQGRSGHGVETFVRLAFEVAIPGPIALGRSRFEGGGLFTGSSDAR
jgi:hypothetical protein